MKESTWGRPGPLLLTAAALSALARALAAHVAPEQVRVRPWRCVGVGAGGEGGSARCGVRQAALGRQM